MLYHRDSLNYHLTIKGIRRLVAAALIAPGAVGAVAGLTGKSEELLNGHPALLRKHGRRYLTDRQMFLSNNTDGPGNPLSRCTRAERRPIRSVPSPA